MTTRDTVILWFRRDLRLDDNAALDAAAAAGRVLPVFVLDDRLWLPAGAPRRAFLAGCLSALDRATGGHLVIRAGRPADVLSSLATEVGATSVLAAADFGPYGRRRDAAVAEALAKDSRRLELVDSPYAVAPGSITNGSGESYKVFTPFYRAWVEHGWEAPYVKPTRVSWRSGVAGVGVPAVSGSSGSLPALPALPAPGEAAARRQWEEFLAADVARYADERDRPDLDATSRLSPYLKWGCIHPRTLLAGLDARSAGQERFRSELCWREFYAEVLWQRPDTMTQSLQVKFRAMTVDEGSEADERFEAWADGRTGYPIVDAGMRQLKAEGWMHNRVRMIVASFLVKDLHLDWHRGARHFMRYLVDGDAASNTHGWQWVAGCGTDAAPYFRIFNPITQGRKFDPDGAYIRRFVPELAAMPAERIHEPWKAGQLALGDAPYPAPIVDHAVEREEALRRYGAIRR